MVFGKSSTTTLDQSTDHIRIYGHGLRSHIGAAGSVVAIVDGPEVAPMPTCLEFIFGSETPQFADFGTVINAAALMERFSELLRARFAHCHGVALVCIPNSNNGAMVAAAGTLEANIGYAVSSHTVANRATTIGNIVLAGKKIMLSSSGLAPADIHGAICPYNAPPPADAVGRVCKHLSESMNLIGNCIILEFSGNLPQPHLDIPPHMTPYHTDDATTLPLTGSERSIDFVAPSATQFSTRFKMLPMNQVKLLPFSFECKSGAVPYFGPLLVRKGITVGVISQVGPDYKCSVMHPVITHEEKDSDVKDLGYMKLENIKGSWVFSRDVSGYCNGKEVQWLSFEAFFSGKTFTLIEYEEDYDYARYTLGQAWAKDLARKRYRSPNRRGSPLVESGASSYQDAAENVRKGLDFGM